MPIIIKTNLHQAWQDASTEDRLLFMQDICLRYKLHIKNILHINEDDGEE